MRKIKDNRAFTLIELLVVISIIGLLSSVVMASLNSAREKSRIGSGKYFATQVDHIAGDQAVGMWDFDECSGASTADRSGNGFTGTFQGNSVTVSDSPRQIGCSISMDGSGDYVTTGLTFNENTYAQSAWIYLNQSLPLPGTLSVFGNDDGSYDGHSLYIRSNGIPFVHNCHPSACNDVNASKAVSTGKWVHLAVSVSAGTASFYIDGQQAGGGSGVEDFGIAWQIGANGYNSMSFNGKLDEVHFFGKALTASEIGRIYASEAPKFKMAAKDLAF